MVRLVVFVAMGVLSAEAQEPKAAVEAEILTLSLSGVVPDLHYLAKGGVAKTTVYSRGFGIPILYEGPQEIVFFRPTANPEGFSGGDQKIISRVVLPSGESRILLLFEKVEDGRLSYPEPCGGSLRGKDRGETCHPCSGRDLHRFR